MIWETVLWPYPSWHFWTKRNNPEIWFFILGHFGCVYRALYRKPGEKGEMLVAVKTLHSKFFYFSQVLIILQDYLNTNFFLRNLIKAQLAGAVEYADCISAEG